MKTSSPLPASIVSSPGSVPALIVSLPVPPRMLSLPRAPSMESLPPSASIVSLPVVPMCVSPAALPVMVLAFGGLKLLEVSWFGATPFNCRIVAQLLDTPSVFMLA